MAGAAVLARGLARLAAHTQPGVVAVLLNPGVLSRAAQIVPTLVIPLGIGLVEHLPPTLVTVVQNVAAALTVLCIARTLIEAFSVTNRAPAARAGRGHRAVALDQVHPAAATGGGRRRGGGDRRAGRQVAADRAVGLWRHVGGSLRFLDDEEIDRPSEVELIADYVREKALAVKVSRSMKASASTKT